MKEVDLGEALVRLQPTGILDFDYRDGVTVDGAVAMKIIGGTREFLDEIRPYPTLVRLNRVAKVTREARAYFSESPENMEIASKIALLAGNPIARVVGNFFLGLNRPARPTRLFGDAETACAWLLE